MSFVQRLINIQISLAQGPEGQPTKFVPGGTDSVILSGLRVSCRIEKAGGFSDSTADIRIYGLTEAMMDQLSTLGVQVQLVPANRIVITAGDATNGMGTVFDGYIFKGYVDFTNAPDVSFVIRAQVGFVFSVVPAIATSFRGATDVATIMAGFAKLMGKKFENNGVQKTLPNPYYYGSVLSQAEACVRAAGIEWNRGDDGVLAIWPKNGSRKGLVSLISKDTGLVGYPVYNAYGLTLKTLFNPSIGLGQQVKVESSLKRASGIYNVYMLDYELETQTRNGDWFMTIGGHNPLFPSPIPGAR